jgi:hypothetical protein
MIGGRLDHYRSSLPRLDTNMLPAPDAEARHGAAADSNTGRAPWLTTLTPAT